jgi:hypothetical protein
MMKTKEKDLFDRSIQEPSADETRPYLNLALAAASSI